jgi:hypothetical protein
MFLGENAVAEHEPRAWLHGMLRQQPGRELRRRLPQSGLKTGIEVGKLRPESYQPNPAIDLSQSLLPDQTSAQGPRANQGCGAYHRENGNARPEADGRL